MMENHQAWAEEMLEKIRAKMAWVSEKNKDKIPYTTDETGSYDDRADPAANELNWWTNGFWGGFMWLLYQDTGEERYAEIARESRRKLEPCLTMFNDLNHDIGFMFLPTAGMEYVLTGNKEARTTAMHAANILAGRFNPVGRFIRAWNGDHAKDVRGWAIIDCMMNLSLLYWASEEGGDPRFRQIADLHAGTVLKYFIRPDGSVRHIVEFDPETGEMVRTLGGQGLNEGSSWTRGQAWAIYGFSNAYGHTKRQEYLDTARRVADYCIVSLPDNGIVPIDLRQPAEPAWEDSCGACIMASGLLELSKYVPEADRSIYIRAAVKILRAIAETRSDWSEDCDAIVQNCSTAYHDPRHHTTMVYADHFFTEALYKLTGRIKPIW